MASCSCCIFNNSATINLADPCVCNAPIGATLVTNIGAIYVRTLLSSPCNINDWTISGTSSFKVADREFGDALQYPNTNVQLSVTLTANFNAGDVCNITHAPFGFTQNRNGTLRSLSIVKEY